MNRVRIESIRMAIYMVAPVALFFYFNQPQYFEKWVVKTRNQIYPPAELTSDQEMHELTSKFLAKKEQELRRKLEEFDAKNATKSS